MAVNASAVLDAADEFEFDDPELEGGLDAEVEGAEAPAGDLAESEEGTEESATGTEDETGEEEDLGEGEEEVEEEEGEEEAEGPTRVQARMRDLSARAARADKFAPLIDMLEEDPNLARQLIARRLGLRVEAENTGTEPARRAEAPRQPTAEEQKQLSEYWTKELKERPAEALQRMFSWMMDQREARSAGQAQSLIQANVETIVENFKGRLARTDPQRFPQYEPYLDALLEETDPKTIIANPKQTLAFLKRAAFGAWDEEQQERIAKARRGKGSKTVHRSVVQRRGLTAPSGAGSGGRSVARATRRLTDEEQVLADRYGIDLVTGDDE